MQRKYKNTVVLLTHGKSWTKTSFIIRNSLTHSKLEMCISKREKIFKKKERNLWQPFCICIFILTLVLNCIEMWVPGFLRFSAYFLGKFYFISTFLWPLFLLSCSFRQILLFLLFTFSFSFFFFLYIHLPSFFSHLLAVVTKFRFTIPWLPTENFPRKISKEMVIF